MMRVKTILFLLPLPLLLVLVVLFALLSPGRMPAMDSLQFDTPLRAGGKVPPIPLPDTLNKEDRRYLGLSRGLFNFQKKTVFSLQKIQADYIVLEFLNRYCVSCLAQAPILNNLYEKIARDKILCGRIKMLAVGAGNNLQEIQRFQKEKDVFFPIVPDPEFKVYEAFGSPGGTPYLLILRQSPDGVLLAKSYFGLIKNGDILLAELRELISLDPAAFQKTIQNDQVFKADLTRVPHFSWSEEEIRRQIRQGILEGEQLSGEKEKELRNEKELRGEKEKAYRLLIHKKDWPEYSDGRGLPEYTGLSEHTGLPEYKDLYIVDSASPSGSGQGKKRWFAKIYKRLPICDVCHPIYFLLIFDKSGVVTNFLPLYVTKHDNLLLTAAETQKLKRKIVGRHLEQNYQFQPEYDSISSATMSVSLIFDTLNKAKRLYQKLQQDGYTANF
jgi:peroxiredoxin